jgi:drug/metabolite transporter (DMT)-like permease
MTPTAYALIVASAATHAYWNLLLKRSGASHTIVGLSKIVEALAMVPLLIAATAGDRGALAASWVWPVVGAALVLLNYLLLTRAYAAADFSLVYPVSRGAMLVFLPPLAFVAIGERIDGRGAAAVSVILVGLIAAHWSAPSGPDHTEPARSGHGIGFALLAALAASGYTLWDKQAVQRLSPLTYFAAYTILVGAAYGVVLRRSEGRGRMLSTLRERWPVIVQVALGNSASYLLALMALRTGNATYVIAGRQLSIVIGGFLGAYVLDEAISRTRACGIALILGGCVLLAWAR